MKQIVPPWKTPVASHAYGSGEKMGHLGKPLETMRRKARGYCAAKAALCSSGCKKGKLAETLRRKIRG